MESAWIIRDAEAGDAAALAGVHVRAWQWAYRGLMPADFLAALDPAARETMWTTTLAGAGMAPIVAVANGAIIGFVAHGPSRDEDAPSGTGEVMAIYLEEAWAGRGVGRALWQAALDRLAEAGHDRCSVWVLDTNARGRAFYERVGMEPDGAAKQAQIGGFTTGEVRYVGPIGSTSQSSRH